MIKTRGLVLMKFFNLAAAWLLMCVAGGCHKDNSMVVRNKAIADAQLAIKKNDFRFATLLGISVSVPGVPDGEVSEFVVSHGTLPPIGVGDFLQNANEVRKQREDAIYAESYNVFLVKYLLANPDRKTKIFIQKVRLELNHFNNANPALDAERSFHTTPVFLDVAGARELGYPIDDSRTAWVNHKWQAMNNIVLKSSERALYDRVLKHYIVAYNETLYGLLKIKWKKQGIKNGMTKSYD